MIKRSILFFFFLCSLTQSLQAMIFDNKFFPLYYKPHIRKSDQLSFFRVQPLFMRSERGQGDYEESGLPEIDGAYNFAQIANALVLSGRVATNPLRSDLRGLTSIPATRAGRFDGEGVAFFYEQYLSGGLSLGTDFLFLHVNSEQQFFLEPGCIPNLTPAERTYLFQLREYMNHKLCVTPTCYQKTVFGDFDLYLRYAHMWHYTCKFRRIDAGCKLGMYAPTSPAVPIDNPAAIPVGGNKHWAIYFDGEVDLELKEDWHAYLMLRAIKRFKRTSLGRMSVAGEPLQYGAVVGPLQVDPGFTFVFAPEAYFEGIRDGFGAFVGYTLVAHLKDHLVDRRADQSIPVDLAPARERSSWGIEHVTVGAFYDFAKMLDCPSLRPTITFAVDFPVDWLLAKRSAKTFAISALIESSF